MAAMLQCAQCKKFYKGKTGLSAHAKNTGHDVDFSGGNANLESTPVATATKPAPTGTSVPTTPVENDRTPKPHVWFSCRLLMVFYLFASSVPLKTCYNS